MHRDTASGRTSGSTRSSLAGACVPGAPGGGCVGLVTSSGSASSDGDTTRSSSLADVFGMSVPLTAPQVDQGATYVGSGFAAVSQTALSGDLAGLATVDAGHSEVLAHQVPGTAVVSPPVATTQPPVTTTPATAPIAHHTSVAQAVAGVLPHTGGIWSGWLAIGLLMLAAGSALAARDLRRGRVTV